MTPSGLTPDFGAMQEQIPSRLDHRLLRDITLSPVMPRPDGRHLIGATDARGGFAPGFAHRWCHAAPPPAEPVTARFAGPVVYGGLAMNHFGHFLLEALSRLWFLQRHPDLPVVWHWIDLPVPHSAWPGWIEDLLATVGLGGHRHHILRRPVIAPTIILPDEGFRTHRWLHPDQAAALARVEGPAEAPGGRIWLSRRGLPASFGRIEGEAEVEAALAARGWTVLRPEGLSAAQKAGLFAAAETVSGFVASAFHAALLQARPRARLRPVIRPAVPMRDYEIMAAMRGLDLKPLDASLEALDARATWTSYRVRNPDVLAAQVDAA